MTAAATLLFAAAFTRTMERVSTMDPVQSRSVYDTHAIGLVYERPLEVDYKARPYRLAPGFCELPEVSPDGLVYVFRRRAAAGRAANGLTMRDMARCIERLRDPDSASPNGWMAKDVDTVRVVGDDAVEIRLRRRCHYFPWLMSMCATAVRGPNGEVTSNSPGSSRTRVRTRGASRYFAAWAASLSGGTAVIERHIRK